MVERDGKATAYRCVMCAMADAKELPGDLAIVAPSEKKGEPVTITRTNGKWAVTPETAVFAFAKGDHVDCQNRYRALTGRAAFDDYALCFAKLIGSTKAITLAELVERSK